MNQTNKGMQNTLEIFNRRKWLIIIPVILGIGISVFIAYSLPSYYRSTTMIIVEHQKVPEAYVMPTDITPIEKRLNTISQQIMSRTKLEQIIEDFKLYREETGKDATDFLARVKRKLSGLSSSKDSKEERVERMRKDIEINILGDGVTGKKGGSAFSISYAGRDPYLVMQVTNTLSSLFIEENLKAREQYAEGTSEFLSVELAKAKEDLENQEKQFKLFKEQNMGRLPGQMEANLRTLDRLQMQLQSTQVSLKNEEDRKAILEEQISLYSNQMGNLSVELSMLKQGIVPPQQHGTLETELSRLKNELAYLLSIYKENYPDVVIAKNRIKELENQLSANALKVKDKKEETKDIEPIRENQSMTPDMMANLSTLKSQIAFLKKQEKNIREDIRIYQKRVEETPASEQMMANIERDYQISQKNYQALLEKKLNARLAENMEKRQKGERFRVIDPANLPEKPYKPNKGKIIIMGSVIGIGIGVGIAYLLELLNPAFRKPEDFYGILDKPVLSTIPNFTKRKRENKVKNLRFKKGKVI